MLCEIFRWRAQGWVTHAQRWKKLRSTGKKDQRRSALLGRWVWGQGNRGGLGKSFLLCLFIFDLVESPNDFNGEDAWCSFDLSTATTALICTYSRTELVHTKLHLLPVHRPLKKPVGVLLKHKDWVFAVLTLAVKSFFQSCLLWNQELSYSFWYPTSGGSAIFQDKE